MSKKMYQKLKEFSLFGILTIILPIKKFNKKYNNNKRNRKKLKIKLKLKKNNQLLNKLRKKKRNSNRKNNLKIRMNKKKEKYINNLTKDKFFNEFNQVHKLKNLTKEE